MEHCRKAIGAKAFGRWVFSLLGAALLTLGAACSGTGEQDGVALPQGPPQDGGALRVAISAEPDVLNPLITTSVYSSRILGILNDGLLRMNERFEFEPGLAQSWSWSEDGREITFHLREGLTWSDGVAFSARDIAATYALVRDPRVGSPLQGSLQELEQVVAEDDRTLRFRFGKRSPDQLINCLVVPVPRHLTEQLDPANVANWPINRQPVSVGHYRLQRWDPGERLVLERNPHWSGKRAHLDQVTFRITPDANVRMIQLETGEIDMLDQIPYKDIDRLRDHPEIDVHVLEGRAFGFLQYNLARPMFQDRRVRKAISLALDRRAIIDGLMYGYGSPASSPLPPILVGAHNRSLTADQQDLASARRLMAEAGWSDSDGDGVLDKDGTAFRFELLSRTGDPLRENGSLILQQNLLRLGVRVDLRLMEFATAIDRARASDFDVYYGHWNSRVTPDPRTLFQSRTDSTGFHNYGGFNDPRVNELLDRAVAQMDPARARPLWNEFQEILHREQPWTFLYYPSAAVGIRKGIAQATPHNLSPYLRLHDWWRYESPSRRAR